MSDDTGNPPIMLRLPSEVGPRLLDDAVRGQCTIQAVILEILGRHYGVEVPPPARGRRFRDGPPEPPAAAPPAKKARKRKGAG